LDGSCDKQSPNPAAGHVYVRGQADLEIGQPTEKKDTLPAQPGHFWYLAAAYQKKIDLPEPIRPGISL
jgi:hypothetical protein